LKATGLNVHVQFENFPKHCSPPMKGLIDHQRWRERDRNEFALSANVQFWGMRRENGFEEEVIVKILEKLPQEKGYQKKN